MSGHERTGVPVEGARLGTRMYVAGTRFAIEQPDGGRAVGGVLGGMSHNGPGWQRWQRVWAPWRSSGVIWPNLVDRDGQSAPRPRPACACNHACVVEVDETATACVDSRHRAHAHAVCDACCTSSPESRQRTRDPSCPAPVSAERDTRGRGARTRSSPSRRSAARSWADRARLVGAW